MNLRSLLFGKRSAASSEASATAAAADSTARWLDIYNGGGEWRYTRKGGLSGGTRKVASPNAAKALCAELSRLCFTENTELVCADKETETYLKRVLDENGFFERFPDFLEKAFALGGGVIKVYRDDGGVRLDFVAADCFVPTKWNGRGFYGGAFGSNVTENGKSYVLAETQEVTDKGLVIENKLFSDSGRELELSELYPQMREKVVIKGFTKPLFVYFGTGAGKNRECPPLGASVFADSEDTLKAIDIVFDSLTREFVLGRKRIIVPSYAVRGEYDENGELKRYFNVNDEVFEAFSTSDTDELKITDNTAVLRVSEHIAALSELLDLLCMQAGLSEGALSFKSGTLRTATEVISRNSRTYRTACFYRKRIANGLARVAENICLLGKMSGELSRNACSEAAIRFADGVCEDEGTRIERAQKLFGCGLISKARAISEVYGISLDEAKSMVKEDNDD
ncbi:MAG: phage portal protein [Oscillospiraceae bacterium]|nr:phage portal protein [Oscillospiraceae bacterium]